MNKNNYFLLTGFPKSGNTWLEMMLFEMACVGGYSLDNQKGLPINVQILMRNKELFEFLSKKNLSFEKFLMKLLNPESDIDVPSDENDREIFSQIMSKSLGRARRLRNIFYRNPQSRPIQLSRFVDPFYNKNKKATSTAQPEIYGCPSKHMEVTDIHSLLPSFKIIHIIRDPRDVLVSYFYHDLGHMSRKLINIFTKRTVITKKLKNNPHWMASYFKTKLKMLLGHFEDFDCPPIPAENYLLIRYENLLSDTAGQMHRVLKFLGCSCQDSDLEKVIDEYAFKTITGGTSERRNSLIRKGRSGDWKNYIDKELMKILGRPFADLLIKLGYEKDNGWIENLPTTAPEQFDFSRFRIKRSACSVFIKYWFESPELQEKYPDPFDLTSDDCYYTWLGRSDSDEVKCWLKDAGQLLKIWNVDIEDVMYH